MLLCLLNLGDEELQHWKDIFNVKKEKHKHFAGKDKKKRSGGRRRDTPQVVINDMIKCSRSVCFSTVTTELQTYCFETQNLFEFCIFCLFFCDIPHIRLYSF